MKKITLLLAILSIVVLVYGIVTTKDIKKTIRINDKSELILKNMNESVGNCANLVDLKTLNSNRHIY